jgi:hypothetical protein
MLFDMSVEALTAPALLGICILLILLGRLVPRPYFTDLKNERDRWREAYEVERVARMVSDGQTEKLLEVSLTTRDILVETFGNGGPLSAHGGPDVVQDQSE